MRHLIYVLVLLTAFSACSKKQVETTEHEHDHGAVKLKLTAYSDQFELFAEADPFVKGEPTKILAHFTNLNDFKPLNDASITARLIIRNKEIRVDEFDLLYNNALGTSAPNINSYEKSLFLTEAQEDIIRELYEDRLKDVSFEQSERIRRRLTPLTIHSNVSYNGTFDTSLTTLKLNDDSKFFIISDDV